MVEFILGGARSGKSRFAEQRAAQSEQAGLQVIYVATAASTLPNGEADAEMLKRILKHQQDRPSHWQTVETPLTLADTLSRYNHSDSCVLVDCLTLWTLNLLENDCLQTEQAGLLEILPNFQGRLILVSNEIGLGVVPLGEFTRRFVDELGRLHQQVAQLSDRVTFMAAGLPMTLKEPV